MSTTTKANELNTRTTIKTRMGDVQIHKLSALADAGLGDVTHLPYSIRVLLESVLRNVDGFNVTTQDVQALASWNAKAVAKREIRFVPARELLKDCTGVPAVVELS